MEANEIKVARLRNTPYFVNYISNGFTKPYSWNGSKGNKVDEKMLPAEVVDWLLMSSKTFQDGELVIVEDKEKQEDLDNTLDEEGKNELKGNVHSREEIVKLLNGADSKLKKALESITVDSEKRFVMDVAKEVKDTINLPKIEILSKWINIPQDLLFADE